jgi:hypothetical protein
MAATAPTIKIAEELHPSKADPELRRTRSEGRLAGGIYNPRSHSRVSLDRRLTHGSRSESQSFGEGDGDEWSRSEPKQKQVFTGLTLAW